MTIGEYLKFWHSISSAELKERYRAYVDNTADMGRKLMPLWDDSGKVLVPYTEQMPVVGITVDAMESYCRYMTRQSGFAYRLPTALEWEKAARGVDGREYVWGNDYKSDGACVSSRDKGIIKSYPVISGSYPEDRSIYGVMDMTGNARELVINPNTLNDYTAKGSSFRYSQRFARIAVQAYASNLSDVGFRCVVELPAQKR